ncbi:hypothetical protein [Blastopirellula marina]|uniref:SMI1/KNR4 family protein n=1 Tax=Blastopirellula marina TaxID=124 RepID=A0A2S8FTB7_9BACT|nr:hypothetical protein [Blastopirellula marina]PQO35428.1 hypothetical protein C5Y98_13780 [Blastopirellula marina]PTL44068.1 hypothetical protein C5Y97_13790 [Blastopirellula marina]
MSKLDPAQFPWLDPWAPLSDPRAQSFYSLALNEGGRHDVAELLTEELRRELCPQHPLYPTSFQVVGFCLDDMDDVLVVTDNAAFSIVCVHLTWQQELLPDWPRFATYPSLSDWVVQMEREWAAKGDG